MPLVFQQFIVERHPVGLGKHTGGGPHHFRGKRNRLFPCVVGPFDGPYRGCILYFSEFGQLFYDFIHRVSFSETHHIPQVKACCACLFFHRRVDRENPFDFITVYEVQHPVYRCYG